jgi:hypothetical protein
MMARIMGNGMAAWRVWAPDSGIHGEPETCGLHTEEVFLWQSNAGSKKEYPQC